MFSEKIKKLRLDNGLTQTALARALGVSQQAVAKWESGRALPEISLIKNIASVFKVSSDFLLEISGARAFPVKVIGDVRAGYDAFAFEDLRGTEPAFISDPEGHRYLEVRGDSMEPFIYEGDLALVRIQPTLENGDVGVVIYGDGEATLKQYYKNGGQVVLKPFNEKYGEIVISGEALSDFRIFGKVIETKTRWE
jgi:repressor LexA